MKRSGASVSPCNTPTIKEICIPSGDRTKRSCIMMLYENTRSLMANTVSAGKP